MDPDARNGEQIDLLPKLPLEDSRDQVESLWRQALNHKSSSQSDLAAAKANRARAEMERHRISNAALEATREACGELIAKAERQLTRAMEAETEAEKRLAESDNTLNQAKMARSEADSYSERVMAEAQKEAQRIRDEASSATLRECADLKRNVTYEVQCILEEIETLRTAAQEELEAQRIYAEAATINAMSQDVRVQVRERVDKVLSGKNGSDVDAAFLEETELSKVNGVGESHASEPAEAMDNSTADGQHAIGAPQSQMTEASDRKPSKRGKEPSRAAP